MTIKEIKKKIDESSVNLFKKSDLYQLFGIKEKTKVSIPSNIDEPFNNIKPKINPELIVSYNGHSIVINSRLLDSKNAWGNIENIKTLHLEKLKVFEKMEKTNNKKELKKYAEKIEQIEFSLQTEWGFPLNKNFHTWYNVPKCTCPKMDNEDNRGTDYRIISEDCPVHGKE